VLLRGAEAVAGRAMRFRQFAATATHTHVNGIPGGVTRAHDGTLFSVLSFTVRGGRIVEIDVLADPDRLASLDLPGVSGASPDVRSGR
jgi:hypothetical protein